MVDAEQLDNSRGYLDGGILRAGFNEVLFSGVDLELWKTLERFGTKGLDRPRGYFLGYASIQ